MDPILVGPAQWDQIARSMNLLYLFTALGLNSAISFLLGHAVLPSLTATMDLPVDLHLLRRALYPVAGISLVLALITFGWALSQAIGVIQQIYPRFWI